MSEAALVVLAKAPRAGRVKTRLTAACSPGEAAALAEAALADTLAAVAGAAANRRVVVLDGRPGAWLPPEFEVIPQGNGDLDARLAAAFDAVGGPALVVGMDTPQVTSSLSCEPLAAPTGQARARTTRCSTTPRAGSAGAESRRCSGRRKTAATGRSASGSRVARPSRGCR